MKFNEETVQTLAAGDRFYCDRKKSCENALRGVCEQVCV